MPSLLSSDLMGRVADGTNMNYVQCPRCGPRTGAEGGSPGAAGRGEPELLEDTQTAPGGLGLGGVQKQRRGVWRERPPGAGHPASWPAAPSLSAASCFLVKVARDRPPGGLCERVR